MTELTPTSRGRAGPLTDRLQLPELPPVWARYERHLAARIEAKAKWDAASPEEREDMFVGSWPAIPPIDATGASILTAEKRRLDAMMAPIPIEWLLEWMAPINASARNPQPNEDFLTRCYGLHAMLDDLPAAAFTAGARRKLGGFFPGADDIRAAIEADAAALRLRERVIAAALAGWRNGERVP